MSDLGIPGLRTADIGPPCTMVDNDYPSATSVGLTPVQVQLSPVLPSALFVEDETSLVQHEAGRACLRLEAQVPDACVLRVLWWAVGCLWLCVWLGRWWKAL